MTSDIIISEVGDSAEDIIQPNQELELFEHDICDEAKDEEPTCSNKSENNVVETNDASCYSDIQNTTESLSVISGSTNKGESTSFDPNFVETYFKVRRVI